MEHEPDGPRANIAGSLIDYTQWIYGLHALSVALGLSTSGAVVLRFAFGLPSIIAVIMNYARRADVRGTWLESHFRWQIRTFWFTWLWIALILLVSAPLVLALGLGVVTAMLGFALVGLWIIYRVVRGWLAVRDGRAMPLPAA